MLSVVRVHFPSAIPVVGCEFTPYILLMRPDNSVSSEVIPESATVGGFCLRYTWFRIQSDKKDTVCSIHPTELATLQCIACIKAKVPLANSYHCNSKCFSDAWKHHLALHERASSVNESGAEEGLVGRTNNDVSTPLHPTRNSERNVGETLVEIGHSRTYIPTAGDIGHVLKFECVPVDAVTRKPVGKFKEVTTSRVIPAPSPYPRRMIKATGSGILGHLDNNGRSASSGTFTVLSYNILADQHAKNGLYSYCPTWALAWPYRRQNLLKEIISYHADIVCLQEVQNDHFEEFFSPELDKHGYQAFYKKKTTEPFRGIGNKVDGCATFFRRDRFSHIKKYEVEFNKAAQSLTDAVIQPSQKEFALNRLIKDNIALILVLEAKFDNHGVDNSGNRQLLCVANTHLDSHKDFTDVKIWQVHTLLKGLEKIAVSGNIPMLVCGDFNSIPGSASHALLAMGKLDQLHPDLGLDPLGILRPSNKLNHQLPLVSAYSAFAMMVGEDFGLELQRRKMDPTTNEPLFTSIRRDFFGTLDYIFYSADSLTVESLLELLDQDSLRKNTALPSPEWSSDHIALLAEFRCNTGMR